MNFNQFINQLRLLNPKVIINVMDPSLVDNAEKVLFSSTPIEELHLPVGVYIEDNSLVVYDINHKTDKKLSVEVVPLSEMKLGTAYPLGDIDHFLDPSKVNEEDILNTRRRLYTFNDITQISKARNIRNVAIELQRVNPGVDIKIGREAYYYPKNIIFCSVPIEELALPFPFYINGEGSSEITNGYYVFQIGDLKTIHPAMVEETGFDLRKLEQEELERAIAKREAQAIDRLIELPKTMLQDFDYDEKSLENVKIPDFIPKGLEKNKKLIEQLSNIAEEIRKEPVIDEQLYRKHDLIITIINILEISKYSKKPVISKYGFLVDNSLLEIFDECYKHYLKNYQERLVIPLDEISGQLTIPKPTEEQVVEETPEEELARMKREERVFEILQLERDMNDTDIERRNSAIVAGLMILGAAAAYMTTGADMQQTIQHELEALRHFGEIEPFITYLQDLGPLTNLLTFGSAGFILKYLRVSKRFKELQNKFEDFIRSLENEKENVFGGNDNARTR